MRQSFDIRIGPFAWKQFQRLARLSAQNADLAIVRFDVTPRWRGLLGRDFRITLQGESKQLSHFEGWMNAWASPGASFAPPP
jgi:hypothetical protein